MFKRIIRKRVLSPLFHRTYKTYLEDQNPEVAANTFICVIHQTNYLLDEHLQQLEGSFLKEGGFTGRLYRKRTLPGRKLG